MTGKVKIAILYIIWCILLLSCEKNKVHPIPNVSVNVKIDLNDAEYSFLRAPFNHIILDAGINGILIFSVDKNVFVAYEVTCPYEYGSEYSDCTVEVDGSLAKCPCCGSSFFLQNNNLLEGPSQWPLKPYAINLVGNTIWIQ
jgi:nitrite reductase/ring-hydroxylating ferredoxin subunit